MLVGWPPCNILQVMPHHRVVRNNDMNNHSVQGGAVIPLKEVRDGRQQLNVDQPHELTPLADDGWNERKHVWVHRLVGVFGLTLALRTHSGRERLKLRSR